MTILLAGGCATVDPGEDYDRAADLISEFTASEQAYTPEQEDQIETRVADLLLDGLSPDESVQIALLNNRELQARFGDIGVAHADLVQSKLWSNPSLFLGFMLPQDGGRSKVSLSFAQEIADLWQIPIRKRLARQKLESEIMGVVAAAVNLAAETKGRYYALVTVSRRILVIQDAVESAQVAVDATQRRFEAGEVSRLDVNLARANMLDLQSKLIRYKQGWSSLNAAFTHLLGLPYGLGPDQIGDELPAMDSSLDDEGALITWAADHRADVQQRLASVAAASSAVQREKRSVISSVSLSLDAERSDAAAPASPPFNPLGTLITPGTTASDLARDYFVNRVEAKQGRDFEKSHRTDWLVGPGMQITLPLFDQNQAQIARGQILLWQEQKRLVGLFETIAEEVRTSSAILQNTRELAALLDGQTLPLSIRTVDTAIRLYEAGEDSVLAVLDAQDRLVSQREAMLDAQEAYALALVELERTLGGRLPDSLGGLTDQADGNAP